MSVKAYQLVRVAPFPNIFQELKCINNSKISLEACKLTPSHCYWQDETLNLPFEFIQRGDICILVGGGDYFLLRTVHKEVDMLQ